MRRLALSIWLVLTPTPLAAQFWNSSHDFSDGVAHTADSTYLADAQETVWNPDADQCIVCHEAHTPAISNPLWHRNMSVSETFAVYGDPPLLSATLDATVGQPDGLTILCLTCHDGVAGLDQYGWGDSLGPGTGATTGYVPPNPFLGDLAAHHPVSFVYDATLATTDGFLFDPTAGTVPLQTAWNGATLTGTIQDALLSAGGTLQCTSCHDVHNKWGNDHLLNIPYAGSELCETCHDKG
jgi:predicted CXXCH cytochrome family protein